MKSSDTKLINTKTFPNKFKQDSPVSHMNSYGGVGGHTHLPKCLVSDNTKQKT